MFHEISQLNVPFFYFLLRVDNPYTFILRVGRLLFIPGSTISLVVICSVLEVYDNIISASIQIKWVLLL